MMNLKEALLDYLLRLADNALILGHRLSEWCGHGPILEQDIAITNIALDFIGQARMLYQYAAEIEGKGRTEDDLAYFRDAYQFKNAILVEQPNEDWAYTIVRQFLFDTYNFYFHQALCNSNDPSIAAYAEKAFKEVSYHFKWSAEWLIRLGDGTAESHGKMQRAIDDYYIYFDELITPNEVDTIMAEENIGVDLEIIAPQIVAKVNEIVARATLTLPVNNYKLHQMGKNNFHSEHLGYILAEMQYLQRAYPGAEW
jgi:ring-1,2-phenylacetyl-CoA epoxidase subunit PaaC